MLKNDRSGLGYAQLVKKAKSAPPENGLPLKMALLADVSTQHLVPLLKAIFAGNGVALEVYEGGFDATELEAYNAQSGLYTFQPQVIVILQSVMKLKAKFHDASGDRASFSQTEAGKIEAVWKAIQSRVHVPIIQSTFVLPPERAFGNYGLKVPDTLQGAVSEVNREISLRARSHPSVFINDIDHIAAWVGRRNFLDEKLYAIAKTLCALEFLPDVAQNIADIALASIGRAVKCVILDLDGLDGIGLGDLDPGGAYRHFQFFLRELSRRGIILAVCSKNNETTAREVFQKHTSMVLKEEHIAVFIANWEDKATNIKRIREKLNIGFDSMVFLDDNPFERNLVRQLIPGIIVPELPEDPGLYLRALAELNLFETASHSSLDAERNKFFQDQEKREAEQKEYASIEEYLCSLQTAADFRRFEPATLSRVAQLIQRSNQFNLTTRRHSAADCEAMMKDDRQFHPFSIGIKDRCGDFGLINVVILKLHPAESRIEIDTFIMSCRVLQRGVEQFAMNKVFEFAQRGSFKTVSGCYIPTAKNAMVENFYTQFGFLRDANAPGPETRWSLDTASYVPRKVFIREANNPEGIESSSPGLADSQRPTLGTSKGVHQP
jgi:FkbH-like protein